ncbi:MAG: hypothetical protein V3U76_15415 [Granulosicoccus sp.]
MRINFGAGLPTVPFRRTQNLAWNQDKPRHFSGTRLLTVIDPACNQSAPIFQANTYPLVFHNLVLVYPQAPTICSDKFTFKHYMMWSERIDLHHDIALEFAPARRIMRVNGLTQSVEQHMQRPVMRVRRIIVEIQHRTHHM